MLVALMRPGPVRLAAGSTDAWGVLPELPGFVEDALIEEAAPWNALGQAPRPVRRGRAQRRWGARLEGRPLAPLWSGAAADRLADEVRQELMPWPGDAPAVLSAPGACSLEAGVQAEASLEQAVLAPEFGAPLVSAHRRRSGALRRAAPELDLSSLDDEVLGTLAAWPEAAVLPASGAPPCGRPLQGDVRVFGPASLEVQVLAELGTLRAQAPERRAAEMRRLLDHALADPGFSPGLAAALRRLYQEAVGQLYGRLLSVMGPDDLEWHLWSWPRPTRGWRRTQTPAPLRLRPAEHGH